MHRQFCAFLISCIMLLTLTGCNEAPERNASSAAPTTQTPTTAVTQPPKVKYTAEQLLRKTILMVSNKYAHAYEEVEKGSARVGSGGVYVRTESEVVEKVVMSSAPFAINAEQHVHIRAMDLEIEQVYRYYYRSDKQAVALYAYAEHLDQWISEKLDVPPSDILFDYTVYGCPSIIPEGLTLDEETVDLDGRQAYVLRYDLTGQKLYQSEDDPELVEKLSQVLVPVTLYVDAETFHPLQLTQDETALKNLLGEVALDSVLDGLGQIGQGETIEFSEAIHTYRNFVFEDVEVPPVPEDRHEGPTGNVSIL